MWLVRHNNGHVTIEDDGGESQFKGDVSVALLGLGRAMHRMEEARILVDTQINVLAKTLESSRPAWFEQHYQELDRLSHMLSLGAAPSYAHNTESTPQKK